MQYSRCITAFSIISFLLILFLITSCCHAISSVSVDHYGAGRNSDDTKAFKKAWEKACSTKGATTLMVPNKKYLVKPIKFEGPCKSDHLTVEIRGIIEASDDRSDYNVYGRHWLFFDGVQNLVVQGGGTLNGKGDLWWRHSCKINKSQALTFHKCEKLVVKNLTVRDAQQIQVSFDHCKNVKASNLTITAPGHSPNTDGIHVTHSQDIDISNSSSAVQVRDVLYQNITGTSATKVAIKFDCSESFPCKGIEIQNVDIRYHQKDKTKALCQNVELTDIGDVTPICPNVDKEKNNNNNNNRNHNRVKPKPLVPKQGVFNVDDFGAKRNGNDDTKAFKKAWKKVCSSNDPAFLVVPQKNYLVKPIKFEGPCKSNLTIQIHGTIEASDDRSDYNDRHWLVFESVKDLVVEGGGTINGNGNTWWKHSCKINKSLPCKEAPTALTFQRCENLVVRNLTVKDSQQIQVTFNNCKKVKASNLTVTAPGDSPNTDGIHVTHTQDIEISNCVIGTGDDCISIVSGSRNVRARDITCGPGHGISIGSLGSENSEAHVSDVFVSKAKFFETTNGVRIKTWQGGSGTASNIRFQDIEMHNVHNPIIIDQNYCDRKKAWKEQSSAVQVKDVFYQNIKGTSSSKVAVKFDCSESFPCEGIVLHDVELHRERGDNARALCDNVELTNIGRVAPLCP
ncbi:Glycoside hydrolase [Parasponia andersonii]|uniref:endo-polygalacturonase n=1 Tax=Parasponia andersonii TaxID=3476 RepID=A0A2P5ADY2_PARAD|nr:Glycoside hydrolase [Parasponia andersonii]